MSEIPCSAYCEPKDGLHVYLDWSDVPAVSCQKVIGRTGTISRPGCCMPIGTRVVCLRVADAPEAGERPSDIPARLSHPLLVTMLLKEER